MKIGFYASALASQQQEKRLAVLANNIANTATPGYKKDAMSFKDFIYHTTHTRMDQGTLRTTENPLDIGLQGNGFLRVQTAEGILYTRAGNLTLSKDRTLVTQDGYPVLNRNGPIQLKDTNVRIDRDGQIFDDKGPIDTIDVVVFPEGVVPEKVKYNYFKIPEGEQPVQATNCTVQQGALEQANFNMVEEMAQLIDTTRSFESYQKVLQSFVQEDSEIITKLGNP